MAFNVEFRLTSDRGSAPIEKRRSLPFFLILFLLLGVAYYDYQNGGKIAREIIKAVPLSLETKPLLPEPTSDGTIDRLYKAIIIQESGGNSNAVNPHSAATGKGQVMPANIGPWSEECLGKRLSRSEFLADAQAQENIIKCKLNQYWDVAAKDETGNPTSKEERVRRVASMWYSGQARLWNNTRPQFYNGHPYPSINDYTAKVWGLYQKEAIPQRDTPNIVFLGN